MIRSTRQTVLASYCALGLLGIAHAQPTAIESNLEANFDRKIDPTEMGRWLKLLSSEPNHVGSPHDKVNAEWVAAQLKSWGWETRVEVFQVLYPTPIEETLELVSGNGAPFNANFKEPPIPGDESSFRAQKTALPGYLTYQGDGYVTAPLVYVNYGMPDDYRILERKGMSVTGKIAIARYGGGWRGIKAKLAQEHGAIGALIYSDPHDDGYALGDTYPKGPGKPPGGIQRGSVYDQPMQPGDPLTPGYGATASAKRLALSDAKTLIRIPVLPLSYGDAQTLLAAMDGPVAPVEWQGSLPITYHLGGTSGVVHIAVKSDWSLKPIYDVIATLTGREKPNSWVIRGNHRDAWVMGATDPLSGQIALLAEAKALGELAAEGWQPKRTIIYASWDGEEPGLLGSVEWAETHEAELKSKGVIYINTDESHRGFLNTSGSGVFAHLVDEVAADLTDPETGVPVGTRQRERLEVMAAESGPSDQTKTPGTVGAGFSKDLPLKPGTGSDATAFMYHLGLPTLYVSYDGEGDKEKGAYHTLYDDYEYHSRFVDPGFVYDALTAKTVGHMVLRLADADLPLQRYSDFAEAIGTYVDSIKKLVAAKNIEARTREHLLAENAYNLSDDPTLPHAPPPPPRHVQVYDFGTLDKAVAILRNSATAFDNALAKYGPGLTRAQRDQLDQVIQPLEQRLTYEAGLPTRPWYRYMIAATGRATGQAAITLPGVTEAVADGRVGEAQRYEAVIAETLRSYAGGLDEATTIINGG